MGRSCLFVDAADRGRYECPLCCLALEDPLQLECGDRVCKVCFETVLAASSTTSTRSPIKCSNCGKSVRFKKWFRDKACDKELQLVQVKCRWEGCEWMGRYCESAQHELVCKWVLKACEYCKKQLSIIKMEAHLDLANYDGCDQLQRPCLFTQFGCGFKGTTHQLNQHESNSREYHSYLIKMVQLQLPSQKACNAGISESMFKQIHDGKYQILKQLYSIGATMRLNSNASILQCLSEIKQLTLSNGNDHQILDKLAEIERATEVNQGNMLKIQSTQYELKRSLCGNNQFACIYGDLRPSYSFICEFKIPNLAYNVAAAKSGQPYSTEEVHIGHKNSSITMLIYLNGEKEKPSWGNYISVSLLVKSGIKCPFHSPVTLCLLYDDEIHTHYQMTQQCTCGLAIKHSTVLSSPYFAPVSVLDNAKVVKDNSINLLCFM